MKHIPFVFVLLILSFFSVFVNAQTLPTGFSASNVGGTSWTEPVGAAFNKNGTKLFVWEKAGVVSVCNWNAGTQQYVKQTTSVLNISEEVGNWRDHGLLGFALDPNFDNNGLIYVMYVVDRHYLINFGTGSYNPATNNYFSATIGRITRYKTITSGSNLIADLSTRKILLGESKTTGIPILHESHGVGSLVFASDGTLLASCGDGASYDVADMGSAAGTYYSQALTDGIIRSNENVGAFRSQMINSLSGKILRLDPATGNGISSNPFYSAASPRSASSRVWTFGLRNPFRFTIRPNTGSTNPSTGDIGEIYIGDVGWSFVDELDIIKAPASNCGWPIFEGITYMDAYAPSLTVNKDEPNPLFGSNGCTQQYFYFQNLIKQATADNNHTVYNPCKATTPISSANNNRFFHRIPVLDWKHEVDSARVGIFSGNNLKVAQIGSAESGVTGTTFRGNASIGGCWYNGDMFPSSFKNTYFHADYGASWLKNIGIQFIDKVQRVDNFASGFTAIVCIIENPLDGSLVYVDIGTNRIRKISYGGNQPPVVQMSSNKTFGPSPLAVSFTGNSSFDPDGSIASYSWNFGDPSSGGSNTSSLANPSHTFTFASSPKKYVVKLTVTDNGSPVKSTTDSIIISVNNTPPVVNITSPVKNSMYRLGVDTTYALTATVSDAQHSSGQLKYEWQTILRHNNHQHAEPIDTNKTTSAVISRIGCNGDIYFWMVKLKVTDAAGLSTTDSSQIFPNCSGNIPLPLHLLSFSVVAETNKNFIKWITESETNLDSFVLERSSDAHDFNPINRQASIGNLGQKTYSFNDNAFPGGTIYYRLKMIDKSGGYYFSKVIRVLNNLIISDNKMLVITPNPVTDIFSLGGYFSKKERIQITILDVNGRKIKSLYETVNTGFNNMQINSLPDLQRGIYFIEVKHGSINRQAKFIKLE